jgi:mRNA-degrading endonuclease RelE of RelBE toxin-antitoxin system
MEYSTMGTTHVEPLTGGALDKLVITRKLSVMAAVLVTPEAQKQFDDLPARIQVRIERIFQRLEHWPEVSGAKPLTGDLAGRYRIRTGDYRVQFYVVGEIVTIEKVGHRDGFYGE